MQKFGHCTNATLEQTLAATPQSEPARLPIMPYLAKMLAPRGKRLIPEHLHKPGRGHGVHGEITLMSQVSTGLAGLSETSGTELESIYQPKYLECKPGFTTLWLQHLPNWMSIFPRRVSMKVALIQSSARWGPNESPHQIRL